MSRFLSILGLVITVAYVAFVYWLVGNSIGELRGAPLNNVGDFLAGVFGPVAILWLILGYFQQGEELRQNTDALRKQAEEVRNSIEHQKALAVAAQQQFELERRKFEDLKK